MAAFQRQPPVRLLAGGYTLIELVIVITVLGVLASIAGTRFFNQTPFAERGYADEIGAALRYTQKVAVSSACPARLALTATTYGAAQQAAAGNACDTSDSTWSTVVRGADGQAVQGSAPAGITGSPIGNYIFDAQGRLSSSPGTVLTVGSRQLRIDAATGYVELR